MSVKSCAITGHRPTRFKFGYKENYAGCKRLKSGFMSSLHCCMKKEYAAFMLAVHLGSICGRENRF